MSEREVTYFYLMIIFDLYMNKDITYALEYHEATKHSEASLMSSRHYLDLENKPLPFKTYLELPSIALPEHFPTPEVNAISCISSMIHNDTSHNINRSTTTTPTIPKNSTGTAVNTSGLDVQKLAEILFFSAGITRELKYPYGTYYMRAASATGALYPIELYIVCDDVSPNLSAGIYHFSPADFNLVEIRKGKYKRYLAASANNQEILTSPITIIFTSVAWRNAWKYQARSYRHWFWDSGVITANLLATTAAMGLPTGIVMGFVDDNIDKLLGLEDQKEATIAMAAIGVGFSNSIDNTNIIEERGEEHQIAPLPTTRIRPLSKKGEINYPEIWELNSASKLTTKEEVRQWINNVHNHDQDKYYQDPLLATSSQYSNEKENRDGINNVMSNAFEGVTNNSLNLKETILWRGSSRKFSRMPISLSTLKTILYSATRGVQMDIFKDGNSMIDIYFIANDVDGLRPGAYFYDHKATSLKKLKEILTSRNFSRFLCLGQSLFGDASVVFFLMTDLQSALKSLGNRGYRACQFEAGIVAGKLYLASYALGIGASGSTFFDDAVTEFFSPHASSKSTMIVVGVGIPAYKARQGKLLARRLNKEQLLRQDFS
jgi:SagB-type dehydrogenase family enzyme